MSFNRSLASSTNTVINLDIPVSDNGKGPPAAGGQDGGKRFKIKKGLDLPISGKPETTVEDAEKIRSVALVGSDYVGLKPTMAVNVGDKVKLGQLLFTDKKTPGVRYTSPASGTVAAVNRGEKRVLLSVVVDLDGEEEEENFASFPQDRLAELSRGEVVENLLASGLWTALRARPFSRVPSPETTPHSLFVNAMDTNPLAVRPQITAQGRENDLRNGLTVISKLTDGKLYLCQHPGDSLPGSDLEFVTSAVFEGPHPAGLVGTHIHFLDPVSAAKTVWHLNLQDVLAIGALFTSGKLDVERIVSFAGSMIRQPRLLRTRIGANLNDLVEGELNDLSVEGLRRHRRIGDHDDARVISGSVLYGRKAAEPVSFLGRYHLQVCAIEEDPKREFLEWHHPGIDRFSVTRLFISKFLRVTKYHFTTCTHGSDRTMVPLGTYEMVVPLDMMPTILLRALIVGDTDQAQALGCLELDEEDLALCTFSCPAKYDFGPILRKNLTRIEIDG
ncbi:MAG: Na(+)-translocating NADH-quinone reductase subunit A [Verrucomicrobiales bacterium]